MICKQMWSCSLTALLDEVTRDEVMDEGAEKLFLEQLETIERAIRFACHRGSLREDAAEDFGSYVKLKLIENDYSVLRKHDRRSSFAAFISVVVQRLLLDYRIAQWGKWHASAEAKRLGDRAIAIEAMLYRDGRTVDEVLPVVQRRWPEVTHAEIEDLTRRLPRRLPRPRAVPVDLAAEEVGADTESVHAAAFERDRIELAQRVNAIVRSVINEIGEHDRAVFRLHFDGGMSIAEIARTLHVEQKPLYRRVQRILAHLRSRLEAEGIGEAEANELLTARCTGLDLDLAGAVGPRRSSPEEGL